MKRVGAFVVGLSDPYAMRIQTKVMVASDASRLSLNMA